MGANLNTPAKCLVCKEQTQDPVTLKCNHQFCRRCIEDLWSISPDGPYCCPKWGCKATYQSLPFDSSLIRPPAPSTAGTSSNKEQTTFGKILRRPSCTSQLLGKRKASTPVSEQPGPKRSTVESLHEWSSDSETPTTSFSDKAGQSTGVTASAVDPERTQSVRGDGTSFIDTPGRKTVPDADASQNSSNQRKSGVILVDDSDSSTEVDICDEPLLATPKKDAKMTRIFATAKEPASPANSGSLSGVSNPGKDKHHISKLPPIFSKEHAAVPGPSNHDGKNTSHVPCHYCPKTGYQSAVKTCLVCGASMCTQHLRPHLDSPVFQNHTLVPPMEDISTWRCQEHQEINRIYCRQCSMCVCTVCTVIGSHRDHSCISIREAERELRGNLKEEIRQLQDAEQQVKNRVTELTHKKETFRVILNEARKGLQQQYGAIREALEQEEQSALQCVMKEESRVLGGLEVKLSHLRGSLQSIQQGLHTLESLADAKGDKYMQDQAFIREYTRIAQLASDMGNCMELFEVAEEVDRARMNCLQRWTEKRLDAVIITVPGKDRDLYRLLYGIIPFLDPDTAHPKLRLSDNNRRVTYSESQQVYTEHEGRFSSFPQVLASHALEGGRWYWEVNVSMDDGRWKVGLCEGQIERKGQKDNSRLGFNSYSWCLACDRRKVEALHNKVSVSLPHEGRIQDMSEGEREEEGTF
uniref:Si:dkey-29p10.4 n=1 Tax=Mastacembelus armatus TaxID=205130 RepID=A0A3Q3NEZ3_9TELE